MDLIGLKEKSVLTIEIHKYKLLILIQAVYFVSKPLHGSITMTNVDESPSDQILQIFMLFNTSVGTDWLNIQDDIGEVL